MNFVLACAAIFACTLSAQDPPVLHNSGTPMRVPFRCTDDDQHWAGMTCSEDEPCPMYLELTHAASAGSRIFLTGNIHSSASTLYSVLLASEDGGASWIEPFARIRGGELDRIQFFDFETGWISGQMLQPLPGDAFLLLSTDGGKTWRKRAVLEEDSPGSILSFRFDSRKNGTLVMDRGQSGGNRYQLFESPNGGESWMIRQTSSQPIQPRETAGDVLWRIRADPAGKSLHVEKREGENWKNAAAFALQLADCKPEPRAETPPPTPTTAAPNTKDYVEELRLGGEHAPAKKRKPK